PLVRVRVGVEPGAGGPERDVDESDEDRYLNERSDDTGKCLTGCGTESADCDGDGELEVVARCGERERRRAGVAEAEGSPREEPDEPHHGEVDEQRQCDAHDVEGA